MGVIRPGIELLENSPIIDIFRKGFNLPGVLPMWAGEFDVPTPRFICEAASQAMFAGRTFYSDNRGTPALRRALIDYHRRLWGLEIADDRIAFTFSGMNAAMQMAQKTVQPGANCIVVTRQCQLVESRLARTDATRTLVGMGETRPVLAEHLD